MNFSWQDAAAIVLVAAAGAYLAWRGWRLAATQRGGCESGGSCGTCGGDRSAKAGTKKDLVTVDSLLATTSARRPSKNDDANRD
jgi:putative hemolysin